MGADDKLKVRVRQSDDGRKKKIKIENEGLEIKIRVKSPKRCQYCGHEHDEEDGHFHFR